MRKLIPMAAACALSLAALPALAQTNDDAGVNDQAATSNQAGQGAATAGFPDAIIRIDVVQLAHGVRASKIIGKDVNNDAGDGIGDINDLIINPVDKVTYAILGVGGFMGLGEHLVAVPFDTLEVGDDNKLVLPGATKESLKQLPEFKYLDDKS